MNGEGKRHNQAALNQVDCEVQFLEGNVVNQASKQDLAEAVDEGTPGTNLSKETVVVDIIFCEVLVLIDPVETKDIMKSTQSEKVLKLGGRQNN